MGRNWMLFGMLALLCAGCASQDKAASFRAKFSAGGLDSDFAEFLDDHAGELVKLDLQWERGAFRGGTQDEFQYFVLFDSCAEKLEKGEKPEVGNCNGTEYNVPKQDGKALLTEEGGTWRLRGTFEPGERSGPLQGLYSMTLDPVAP